MSALSDHSATETLRNDVFESELTIMQLPHDIRAFLLTYHNLDPLLAPIAAQQCLLQHIFLAECFVTTSSTMSHCSLIQNNFNNNPQNYLAHIYDSTLSLNLSIIKLASYCEALGMHVHELKSS